MNKLSGKTNEELIRLYRKDPSNLALRNEIVLKNEGLIHFVIKRNSLYVEGIHEYEELVQEGFLKLIEAVERFDPERGVRFSTYACRYILSMTRGRTEYNKDISLETPVNDSDESIRLEDILQDEEVDVEGSCIDSVFRSLVREQTRKKLDSLTRNILSMYYNDNYPISKIACELALPKADVLQMKNKALRSLRGMPFFNQLYRELFQSVSYLGSMDYSREKVMKSDIADPTAKVAIKRIDLEQKAIKKTLNHSINAK